MTLLWTSLAAAVLLLAIVAVPQYLLRRAQDRLAGRIGAAADWILLTRADLVIGRYRRVPGVLGLSSAAVSFEGVFEEQVLVPTFEIQKIETGVRLSTGRRLLRAEVLRITRSNGDRIELLLSAAAAFAWRSHLGLWAVRERQAHADKVVRGN